MRKISQSLVDLFALTIIFTAITVSCVTAVDVPYAEERSHNLNEVVMCPVCPGESIDQSQNPLAVQMRAIVKEKIQEGWTDKQIKDYFVAGYGPSILLEPPGAGVSLVIWIVPPIVIAISIVLLIFGIRSMTRQKIRNSLLKQVDASEHDISEYSKRLEKVIDETYENTNG